MAETSSLQHLNTFGVDVRAARFASPDTAIALEQLMGDPSLGEQELLILGEGSNILFTRDFEGLVIRPDITGIYVLEDYPGEVVVKVGASENWDQWVEYALKKGWYGLENLSRIPGSVGAAPVQNIGAYGTELKNCVRQIHAWDRKNSKPVELCYKDCHFSYRNSIFKSSQKGRYIITHVCFNLKKKAELNLGYGRLREAFEDSGGSSAMDLRKLVIRTRQSKLPDHKEYGNAGSFFKNPIVPRSKLEELQETHPGIPHYPEISDQVKIPAAWLIDQAGWKGRRKGDVGAWPHQPLVLVNYGRATGQEIYDFSQEILEDILSKYGILLEREVNVL